MIIKLYRSRRNRIENQIKIISVSLSVAYMGTRIRSTPSIQKSLQQNTHNSIVSVCFSSPACLSRQFVSPFASKIMIFLIKVPSVSQTRLFKIKPLLSSTVIFLVFTGVYINVSSDHACKFTTIIEITNIALKYSYLNGTKSKSLKHIKCKRKTNYFILKFDRFYTWWSWSDHLKTRN